jgi:hypothetical protein
VSSTGDGAELRTPIVEGYGDASTFDPRKEGKGMPGNYDRAGVRDIRRWARGVTPTSDVTGRAKAVINLGTMTAAGW